ncbi:putative tartrate dehydrogenase/decarboxylase [Sporomusaceae bacterium FL31]|nr:putative tartrate dehydrogenase/decarboxylase [Sporomusaceae bacterium FL31]GCE34891.1 putative tartrate dehydrogenase/decarboxylase [Sporomusaceae bacterium]
MKHIAIIPGDGIGVDVTREAVKVLKRAQQLYGLELVLTHFDWSAEKYLKEGIALPEGALELLRNEYDAILAGAFGDPRVPTGKILFKLRFGLDLYVNFRPIKLLDETLTPLKNRTTQDINFVIFRENTEGMYINMGGIFKKDTPDEIAIQEDVNTRKGVERIIIAAFEYAQQHGRKNALFEFPSRGPRVQILSFAQKKSNLLADARRFFAYKETLTIS